MACVVSKSLWGRRSRALGSLALELLALQVFLRVLGPFSSVLASFLGEFRRRPRVLGRLVNTLRRGPIALAALPRALVRGDVQRI